MNKSTPQIEEIYQDLLSADPSFGQNENETKTLLAQLVAAKNRPEVDQAFAESLRQSLKVRMARKGESIGYLPLMSKIMKRLNFAITAAVAVAVVVLIALNSFVSPKTLMLPGKQELARAQDGAFGSLANLALMARGQGGGGGDASGFAGSTGAGLGGGSGESALAPSAPISAAEPKVSPPGIGGGGGFMSVPVYYKFVYKGEEFSVAAAKMDVLRRVKGFGTSTNLNSFLDKFQLDQLDISKFANAKLASLYFMEDREFGYSISIDLNQGVISIGENWEKWQTPDRLCREQNCYEQYRLKLTDIPSDGQVIALVNNFLAEYGISTQNYGEPYVQNFWRTEYDRLSAQDKTLFYVPDYVTVIYPLKVNGQEILDEAGNKTGLMVNVNVRVNKVSSVSELTSQRFEASAYATEQNAARIREIAERGGFRSWYPVMEGDVQIIELGTPTVSYVRMWHDLKGIGQEIMVPSMVFPLLNKPANYYQQNVIVPLIKEILDAQPPVEILPMPLETLPGTPKQ